MDTVFVLFCYLSGLVAGIIVTISFYRSKIKFLKELIDDKSKQLYLKDKIIQKYEEKCEIHERIHNNDREFIQKQQDYIETLETALREIKDAT